MINLSQILEQVDSSISWNRKLPHVLKGLNRDIDRDDHKLSNLVGQKWEKIDKNYFIKDSWVCAALIALADKEEELLSTKLHLKAATFENDLLSKRLDDYSKKADELPNNMGLGKWEDYFKMFLVKIGNSTAKEIEDLKIEAWLLMSNYTTAATVRNRLTEFRKIIESSKLLEKEKLDLLDHFSLPLSVNSAIDNKIKNENKERMRSQERQIIKIRDLRKMIEALERDILITQFTPSYNLAVRSELATKCLAFLAAVTGRRPIELINTGFFRSVPKKPNYLNFSGQAKIKNLERADEFEITIPILFSNYVSVMKAIDLLRSCLGGKILAKKNDQIKKSISPMIDRYWTKTVEKYDLKFEKKLSSLRSVYAVACEKIFNQSQTNQIAQSAYIGNILGHLEYDSDTWEFYYDFVLDGRGVDIKRYLITFRKENHE